MLITEAPEHLRIFISKWDEKNDAAKNKKLIDKATTENYAREVLAYLWNTDVENNAVKALTKKDDILFQLVIALENLLPEQCKKTPPQSCGISPPLDRTAGAFET